jgi:hypothetical protein
VIDEIETDNWGIGGETVTAIRGSAEAPTEESPKRRLPEKLIQFQEQRKRQKMEAVMSAGVEGDMAGNKTPAKKDRKKKSE